LFSFILFITIVTDVLTAEVKKDVSLCSPKLSVYTGDPLHTASIAQPHQKTRSARAPFTRHAAKKLKFSFLSNDSHTGNYTFEAREKAKGILFN
jgi:hypothetical protein